MEVWFLIIISISICALLKSIFHKPNLPPGPITIPIVGNILWLRKSFNEIEPVLRQLHAKYGAIVTLHIGSLPSIFICDRAVAYKTLIQNGAIFSDRPPGLPTYQIFTNYQNNITAGCYGPTWRLFRRNLTSEILHPSRIRSYKHARNCIKFSSSGDPIRVVDHFQYAMFRLLVLMCFGDKLEEDKIIEIETVQRCLLLTLARSNLLNFWPKLSKILLRNRWKKLYEIRKNQEDVLIPLIRARIKMKEESLRKAKENCQDRDDEYVVSYVDTLLDLQLPDDKRKLSESEIVSLCSEFLNAGTDTTSTALQWIMANLVKSPEIQEKVFAEINGVLESRQEEVTEDDVKKMPYLKAVILEGLRRHPPGHFVLPHAVSKDVELDGYLIPKKGVVNFTVAEMGWDPKVWEDPMAFKPERFLKKGIGNGGEVFDITGSRDIKMMPFGAGRRICPAYALAMLHLEYFVANMVWKFKWRAVDGDDVDLSEKQEFTVVMKKPLQAYVTPRSK